MSLTALIKVVNLNMHVSYPIECPNSLKLISESTIRRSLGFQNQALWYMVKKGHIWVNDKPSAGGVTQSMMESCLTLEPLMRRINLHTGRHIKPTKSSIWHKAIVKKFNRTNIAFYPSPPPPPPIPPWPFLSIRLSIMGSSKAIRTSTVGHSTAAVLQTRWQFC